MDTTSLWQAISSQTEGLNTLKRDIEVDVAVIGGGITGITAGLQLNKAGKTVVILEAGEIGGVTTGSSTGNLYIAVQPYYQNIVSKFNLATAKTVAHSRKFAIDYIETNIQTHQIQCNFARRPWYAYANEDSKVKILEKEAETFKKMEIEIEDVDTLPLPFKFKKALKMTNQARFNPLEYVIKLAEYLQKKDCQLYEKTRVVNITEKKVCTLETENGHKITAKKVIMATHTPIGVNTTQLFTAPYRSYVVAVKVKDNNYPEGHFWDLDQTHHATCTHAISTEHPELLMVAGSHHKVGQGKNMQKHYQELQKFLEKHFSVAEVTYQWSAQHYQSADNIPYIGLASRFAKHVYMATGYFADGLIYGTLAGLVLSDLILEKENSYHKTYRANRIKPFASSGFLMKEDGNVFLQYYKDLPMHETKKFDDIKNGEGKVVELEREKWGVSRDESGKLHMVSAVCTHMKCIVNWNNAEKTWDCPCHGSRFTCKGKVIEGPAKSPLKEKDI